MNIEKQQSTKTQQLLHPTDHEKHNEKCELIKDLILKTFRRCVFVTFEKAKRIMR
jgi:hypothetical protein